MPSDRGDDGRDRAGRGAEQQRAPRAPRDLREDVAALVGRAEEMVQRRCCRASRSEKSVALLALDEQRREQAEQDHPGEDEEPDARPSGSRAAARASPGRAAAGAVARRPASAPTGSSRRSGVQPATSASAPHAWIEDEVEDVHDEVRDDRAEREDEQQRLRQRVVVAERRLLQRVAGARIAEDELDEDDAADRRRELRARSRSAAAGSRSAPRSAS